MKELKDHGKHVWFDVGWGRQCGVCGIAQTNGTTDAKMRAALIESGVLIYDIEKETADDRS